MPRTVLITGGAGFIGSHLAGELLDAGYAVRVLDNLCPQVHGERGEGEEWPEYLDTRVERVLGDVEDPSAVREALDGCDGVAHLAAMVGVGQSMYQIERYTRVNDVGTAVLLEALIERPVERLLVASSMSIYGEGLYRCHTPTLSESGGGASEASGAEHLVHHASRSVAQLQKRQWEPTDSDGQPLQPIPTPESKQPELASIYALNKYVQERSCLITGRAYGISTVAMRFFNVYGPHQALSNPYTGVLAIFASRLLNGKPPLIFEDGLQRRDFVSVRDIARGCRLALEADDADLERSGEGGRVFNLGSGEPVTILDLARRFAAVMGLEEIEPRVTGEFRVGDIRHCFADVTLARRVLGYEPRVTLEAGMRELAEHLEGQAATDRADEARAELAARGLTV